MRVSRLLLVAVIAAVLVPVMAQAAPVERSEEYVAGFAGDTDGLCAEDNPAGMNVGVVCIEPTRVRADITIEDASGLVVAGFYVFTDADGAALGSAISFCGSRRNAYIPDNAAMLVVYIGGPALGPLTCLLDGPGDTPGIGTIGTVTTAFKN